MTNEITIAPVSILVEGKTKVERQTSVVRVASATALTACLTLKGKVGNAIRESGARAGLTDVVNAACNSNYKPLAEMIAIRLGEPIFISNRSSFESLPDTFQARIAKCALSKNGGYVTDKKTGALKPGAKLAAEMELLDLCQRTIAAVAKYHEERKANTEVELPALRRAA